MKKVGVFFHPIMASFNWPIIGNKYERFPQIMGDLLHNENVSLFESPFAPEEILLACHSPSYLEGVKKSWYWEGASRSVGGCLLAAEKIMEGEIKRALVFTVAAGHHASRDFGWGGTYLSCSGPTVYLLRQKGLAHKIAILDTDCHHGDGTRSFFVNDPQVLHVCFCHMDYTSPDNTKVDRAVPYGIGDERYLQMVREEFGERVKRFRPDLIFHNFGHDTCQGDYGDKGLSVEFFKKLAQLVKDLSDEVCEGRYMVISHGGYLREVAERVFRDVLEVLLK